MIADSVHDGANRSIGLLTGQDVFTVADMPAKLDAQLRGLGAAFLPNCVARTYIDIGRLVVKSVEREQQQVQPCDAWRKSSKAGQGWALQWWLDQRHSGDAFGPVRRSSQNQLAYD